MTDLTATDFPPGATLRAEARIDLDAIRANTRRIGQIVAGLRRRASWRW